MSGYMAGFRGLWASALPHIAEPPNPSAGAGYSTDLDNRYWWSLQAVTFNLTTDGNAGNRVVSLQYVMVDGNPLILGEAQQVVVASATNVRFLGYQGAGLTGTVTNTDCVFGFSEFPMAGGRTFSIAIANVQAGDQLSKIKLAFWRLPTNPSIVEQFAGDDDE